MKKLTFVLLLFLLVGCGTLDYRSEGPPLIMPAIPTVLTDTVGRGNVIHKELHAGAVRLVSRPVSFDMEEGDVAVLEKIYILSGDRVLEGELIARLRVEHFEERIDDMRERIASMRRSNELHNNRQSLFIASLIQEHFDVLRRASETLDTDLLERAIRLEESIELQQLALIHAMETQSRDLQEANRQLALLEQNLEGTTLYAPFDGIVTWVASWEGQMVNHDTHIMYIASEEHQFVQYVGTSLRLQDIVYFVRLRAFINGEYHDLEFASLTPEEREFYTLQNIRQGRLVSHRFPIRFNIVGGYSPPIGSFVNLHLYHVFLEDVLRLPRNALNNDRDGDYVMVFVDGVPEQVYVEAVHTPTYVAILDGLEEGDVVVVTH